MKAIETLWCAGLLVATFGCSSPQKREPRYTIIRPNEQQAAQGGISPDKEAEIQLVLQNRESAARKCYQDVLNEKHDRGFQGSVRVLISIQPSGQASSVKVIGGSLSDRTVQDCLVQTIKEFEFPQLTTAGDVQYEYRFRPAY
jgi:TonB family protein